MLPSCGEGFGEDLGDGGTEREVVEVGGGGAQQFSGGEQQCTVENWVVVLQLWRHGREENYGSLAFAFEHSVSLLNVIRRLAAGKSLIYKRLKPIPVAHDLLQSKEVGLCGG
jgi:hypothetical protein